MAIGPSVGLSNKKLAHTAGLRGGFLFLVLGFGQLTRLRINCFEN